MPQCQKFLGQFVARGAPSTTFEAYKKVSAGSAASGGHDIFGRGETNCHAALEAASTGFAAIARSLIDERYSRINHTWGRLD